MCSIGVLDARACPVLEEKASADVLPQRTQRRGVLDLRASECPNEILVFGMEEPSRQGQEPRKIVLLTIWMDVKEACSGLGSR